jgi:hypothetical protein
LFHHFTVLGHQFLDFSSPQQWFLRKVFPSRDPLVGVSSVSHREAMRKAMRLADIHSSKLTHIARKSAPVIAGSVEDEKIRRLGRWNSNAMEKCYMGIPHEALRSLAGFRPDGMVYIPRASHAPPDSLKEQVFPRLKGWKTRYATGENVDTSISAHQCMKLLEHLSVVVLQDAAVLMDMFPGHPLFQHEIFESDEFLEFKQAVDSIVQQDDRPAQMVLRELVPNLVEFETKATCDQVVGMSLKLDQFQSSLVEQVAEVREMLTQLTGGGLTFRLAPASSTLASSSGIDTNAVSERSGNGGSDETRGSQSNETTNDETPPEYKLSRRIITMHELWKEYTVGLSSGPAVSDLENNWGTRWRQNGTESRYFNRRNVIYKEVARMVADGDVNTVDEAVAALETKRTANHTSLDGLMKIIQKKE